MNDSNDDGSPGTHLQSQKMGLTKTEILTATLRTSLQLVPFGVGSAITQGYFGTIDEKRLKNIEAFITDFSRELQKHGEALNGKVDATFFESDTFCYIFDNVSKRVMGEISKEKLTALRGVLVSIVLSQKSGPIEKEATFLKAIDALEATHVQVLQLLYARASKEGDKRFLSFSSMNERLGIHNEADENYVYSVVDTLANREYVQSGPIPWDSEGRIHKPDQAFRVTALGIEFLEFVRMAP